MIFSANNKMAIPLWLPDNKTLDSSIFEVAPGMAVSLFAIGLEQYKVRQNSKTPLDNQKICVNRILQSYNEAAVVPRVGPAMNMCDCDFIFVATWPTEIELIEETVMVAGCPWQLTQCNNFRIVATPGIYRLHLNDDTAIGKAQVYAEQFDIQSISGGSSKLFFSE